MPHISEGVENVLNVNIDFQPESVFQIDSSNTV